MDTATTPMQLHNLNPSEEPVNKVCCSSIFSNTYQISVSLSARTVTTWSTMLSGTRSGWDPANRRTSTCHPSEALPACSAHGKLARAIFSACVFVATIPVKKWQWSWGRTCCECICFSILFRGFCFALLKVQGLLLESWWVIFSSDMVINLHLEQANS